MATASHKEIPELSSVGLAYPQWQDALEAAYASGQLSVIGEVSGGQVLQYADTSGATLTILAAPPYGSFVGLHPAGQLSTTGHVTMVNDLIGIVDIVADSPMLQVSGASAPIIASFTATVGQGPMIAEQEPLEYQPLSISALATDVRIFPDAVAFAESGGTEVGSVSSRGLSELNNGSTSPHAQATVAVEVSEAELKTNELNGQQFWALTCRRPFEFCLAVAADHPDLPTDATRPPFATPGAVISGDVQFAISINDPGACSPGGCGSGDCGCGGH
ncbi:hypothetical protein [Corynebacterium urealyticum]|uniref:hypothetical protein n=1 Tax=Corynebacterium urealyticum TaxID=43771 RepID=UPI00293F2658|nr:hypothetical protein [Corynebacterium urealyticum]WOH95268.1 hypothetical protein RZ943_04555 [Corynebacterium urealyticum]